MSLCGFLGDFAPGSVIRCKFNTADPKGTGSALTGGIVKAYKDSSTTTEITTGLTLTPNFDTLTGLNDVVLDTSTDAAFYAAGSEIHLVLTAGMVGGVSIAGQVIASFGLHNRSLRDAPGVTTLLTRLSAVRAGYLDNLSAGAVALQTSLQALITTVGVSAAGVAVAVWGAVTRTLTAGTNIVLAKGTGVTGFTDLDAAGVRSAIGLAAANMDTQFSGIPTATTNGLAAASYVTADHGAGSYLRNTEPLDAAGVRSAVGLAAPTLDTQLAALKGVEDTVLAAVQALSIPLAADNAAALLVAMYEGTETVQDGLRLIRAALVGAADGFGPAGAEAGHFKNRAGDKNRLTVTVDEFGNRTKVMTNCY